MNMQRASQACARISRVFRRVMRPCLKRSAQPQTTKSTGSSNFGKQPTRIFQRPRRTVWRAEYKRSIEMFVGDHIVSSSVPLISSDPVQPNKKSVLANFGNHIGETANNFLEALPVANRIVHWANERYGVAEERDRFLCARINDLTAALRDILAQFDIRETEDLKLKLLQADPHERQVIYQNILKELILKAILAERSQSLPATEGE